MAVGSDQRRRERRAWIMRQFDPREVEAALDLLELTDMAWHDCYSPREFEEHQRVMQSGPLGERYRDLAYVRAETEQLAEQLAR